MADNQTDTQQQDWVSQLLGPSQPPQTPVQTAPQQPAGVSPSAPSAAPAGGDWVDQLLGANAGTARAQAAATEQPREVPKVDDDKGIFSKAWDWANTPIVDAKMIHDWTGWSPESGWAKGLEDVATGMSSPLSLAFFVGAMGAGGLVESGASSALRAAGMAAGDIADVSKGAQILAKTARAGKPVAEAFDAMQTAGLNVDKVRAGFQALADSGMTQENILRNGIAKNTGTALLRHLGMGAAKADNVFRGIQAMIDGGFAVQNAYGAAVASPRVLDALKDGDYDTAERLAVDAGFGAGFGVLGAKSFFHEAGETMHRLKAETGLAVAPSEETRSLMRVVGDLDREKTERGRAHELQTEDIRKRYPEIKSPEDKGLVRSYMESGLDKEEMIRRYNMLAEAAGRPDRLTPGSSIALTDQETRDIADQRNKKLVGYGVNWEITPASGGIPGTLKADLPTMATLRAVSGQRFVGVSWHPEEANRFAASLDGIAKDVPPQNAKVMRDLAASIRQANDPETGLTVTPFGEDAREIQIIREEMMHSVQRKFGELVHHVPLNFQDDPAVQAMADRVVRGEGHVHPIAQIVESVVDVMGTEKGHFPTEITPEEGDRFVSKYFNELHNRFGIEPLKHFEDIYALTDRMAQEKGIVGAGEQLHGQATEVARKALARIVTQRQNELRTIGPAISYEQFAGSPDEAQGIGPQAGAGGPAERGAGSPAAQDAGGLKAQPENRVGVLRPTAKDANTSHDPNLQIGMDAVKRAAEDNPKYLDNLAAKIASYPEIKFDPKNFDGKTITNPQGVVDDFVKQMQDNIEWVYGQVPDNIKQLSKQWYDAANQLTGRMAVDNGISHPQAAGVTAVLSPQNEWDNNLSLAYRLIDIWKNKQNAPYSPEMAAKAQELQGKSANVDRALKLITGKSFNQIKNADPATEADMKAVWVRLYDEAHNSRIVFRHSPEGRVSGTSQSDASWFGLDPIAKAISILEDGSMENIHQNLGYGHKVRSFYNNIIDPNSPAGDVTIDTHAVGVAHLQPFSLSNKEVLDNFGGISNSKEGVSGMYPLYAEAYRRAAANLGILPRELQSITWDGIRTLFNNKTEKLQTGVRGLWRDYVNGDATLDQTRNEITKSAGGFKRPVWLPNAESHETYGNPINQGKLSGDELSRANAATGGRGPSSGVQGIRLTSQDEGPLQGKEAREMSDQRLREVIDQHNIQKKYSGKEIDALLKENDPRRLTSKHSELAKELNDYFSKNFERAHNAGVIDEALEHYVSRFWKKEDLNNQAANRLLGEARSGRFSTNTVMARHRALEHTFEGQLLGMKLSDEARDPTAMAGYNGYDFDRVIATRKALDRLRESNVRASDGRPMVALSGQGAIVHGPKGENPAVLVDGNKMRSIRIANGVIEGLRKSGDLARLEKAGNIVKYGEGNDAHYMWSTKDYLSMNHPAFRDWNWVANAPEDKTPIVMKSDLRVHPEAHEYLKRQIESSSPLAQSLKPLFTAGREAKGLLLSFSPFHIVQEGLRAIMTGISPIARDNWDLRTNKKLADGVAHGLTLKDYGGGAETWTEGRMGGHSGLIKRIPGLAQLQDWTQSFLFDKYIPSLKARAYEHLRERYDSKYGKEWSQDKISEEAAKDTNERFGGLNLRREGRALTTQDAFRIVALAPDWLESEMRFMARAFGHEGRVARADVAKMTVGLWAVARVLNLLNTGKAHYEAPFGVASVGQDGKEKVFSLRTMPTDMLHALSDPAGFLKYRASPLAKAATEVYTGRDDFGHHLPPQQIFGDVVGNLAPIPVQTIAKNVQGIGPEMSNPDQIYKASGGTVHPYETEAQKKAAEVAFDHSEQGAVPADQLRIHRAKIDLEDKLRSGQIKPEDLSTMVDSPEATISHKEAREIFNNVRATVGLPEPIAKMYTRASRAPMKDFLDIYEAGTPPEKAALQKLLVKKQQAYYKKVMTEMTPQQRQADPTYQKLRQMFPQALNY